MFGLSAGGHGHEAHGGEQLEHYKNGEFKESGTGVSTIVIRMVR